MPVKTLSARSQFSEESCTVFVLFTCAYLMYYFCLCSYGCTLYAIGVRMHCPQCCCCREQHAIAIVKLLLHEQAQARKPSGTELVSVFHSISLSFEKLEFVFLVCSFTRTPILQLACILFFRINCMIGWLHGTN